MTDTTKPTGLALLREPFPAHQISKLPKPTKKQTDDVRADFKLGIRCTICGAWHHRDVVHLDYVGHAALTYRLLDCDPAWDWQPMALTPEGLPAMTNGGMRIKLTVCDVTRLGFGHADGKSGGDAIKEVIGDALRNAAIRFGAALDLWHKGDLHGDDDATIEPAPKPEPKRQPPEPDNTIPNTIFSIGKAATPEELTALWNATAPGVRTEPTVKKAFADRGAALKEPTPPADMDGEIPY